jgi:hypothetical protein
MISAILSAPEYFELSDAPVYQLNDFAVFLLVAGFFGLQIAAGTLLWKAYVVGSPTLLRGVSVLGLNEATPQPVTPTYLDCADECEPAQSSLTALRIYLYLLTSLATFALGVLAFEAVHRFI